MQAFWPSSFSFSLRSPLTPLLSPCVHLLRQGVTRRWTRVRYMGPVVYLLCVYKTFLNDVTIAAGSTIVLRWWLARRGTLEKVSKQKRRREKERDTQRSRKGLLRPLVQQIWRAHYIWLEPDRMSCWDPALQHAILPKVEDSSCHERTMGGIQRVFILPLCSACVCIIYTIYFP